MVGRYVPGVAPAATVTMPSALIENCEIVFPDKLNEIGCVPSITGFGVVASSDERSDI